MNRLLILPIVAALVVTACEKKETEAERKAEIERQVQERLTAEHQAREQQPLSQAQTDLNVESQQTATAPAPEERRGAEETVQVSEDQGDEGEGPADADYSTFYNRLEPEGDWIETSTYGYVFQPRVATSVRTWRPYTDGRWVYTDAGWTWISDESFGWACYHYGRWTRIRNVGWVWVPGNQWAPAWVSWRTNDQYVGWAPLPPEARFERRSGIHHWADSYYDIGPEQYSFVSAANLGEQRLDRVVVPAEQNITIVNQTTNVTNITFNNTIVVNNGPNYDQVRARSRQPIERLRLERQTNANVATTDPRAVVRGDTVQIASPVIGRAHGAERPRAVRQNISQVEVERGWENIPDRQAAEQARSKIRSEATPPPNAPSNKFVRPTVTNAAASSSAAATPMPVATRPAPLQKGRPMALPTATATPAAATPATTATTTPVATPPIVQPPRVTPPIAPRRVPPIPRAESTATATETAPFQSGNPRGEPFRPHRQPPAQTPTGTEMPSATATPPPARGIGGPPVRREPPERDQSGQGNTTESRSTPAPDGAATAQPNNTGENQLGVAPHGPPQRQRPQARPGRMPPSPTPTP